MRVADGLKALWTSQTLLFLGCFCFERDTLKLSLWNAAVIGVSQIVVNVQFRFHEFVIEFWASSMTEFYVKDKQRLAVVIGLIAIRS